MNHENLTVSLYVRWLISLLFCAFLSLFMLSAFYNRVGAMITQLCCMGIYYAMTMQACYTRGQKDRNKELFGKMKVSSIHGLLCGLKLSIPTVAVSVLFLIFHCIGYSNSFFLLCYRLINAPYYALNLLLIPTALSMNELSTLSVIVSCLLPLIVPVLCGLAYYTGCKGEEIPLARLIPKKTTNH